MTRLRVCGINLDNRRETMERFDLLLELQDVDYFLLKEYYIMRNIIDKSPSGEDEIAQVKVRVNVLAPQRKRLESCMRLIEQGKLSESYRQIGSELDIVRQFFGTEIRYAKRGMPSILNPDDERLSQYVINHSKILKVYHDVLQRLNSQARGREHHNRTRPS